MNTTPKLILGSIAILSIGLMLIALFTGTVDNIENAEDNFRQSACGESREQFEMEKNSGSMLQAQLVKQRAEDRECSWPSEVTLDYEPNECPSSWVIAC